MRGLTQFLDLRLRLGHRRGREAVTFAVTFLSARAHRAIRNGEAGIGRAALRLLDRAGK